MNLTSQSAHDVRFEWGDNALQSICDGDAVVIIIDVLSFSTCVDIACARGAKVLPYPFAAENAAVYAEENRARLATKRSEAGFSLSPTSLTKIDRGNRLVLPSPNGSALSFSARGAVVLTGCFRNASAIARFAFKQGRPVAVIAAGERWPDGTLRPAIEDLLCAGTIIEQLAGARSPEAATAAAAFVGVRSRLNDVLSHCASAIELKEKGFGNDVELALQLDVSECVPTLIEKAFVAE